MSHSSILVRYAGPLVLVGLGVVLLMPGGSDSGSARSGQVAASVNPVPVTIEEESALLTPAPLSDVEIAATPVGGEPSAAPLVDEMATASVGPQISEALPQQPIPPALSEQQGTLVHVGGRAVNMRAGPSKDTARLLTLQPGDPVSLKEVSDNWAFVVTAAGESGWVYSSYLRDGSEPAVASVDENAQPAKKREAKKPVTAQVRGNVVVRAAPSQSADRLFVIEPGEDITIVETRGRWARVVVDGGISGWVRLRRAN